MNNYTIITDSSCDLPDSLVKELELEVLPLAFIMDGKTYRNYPDNREMAPKDFYNKQREGSMATTNAVNVGEAADAMEAVLKRGEDVLVLAFSSGLSTTCNSFQIAAQELAERVEGFVFPKKERPEVLILHASSHHTSNTIDLWSSVREKLEGRCTIREIGLRNGTLSDCSGCPYTMCLHFGEQGGCFYGGVMQDEVYPAVRAADALVLLCPNYNDALSANLTAFVNRLTALFRQSRFYDKRLYGLIVSGYSGGDLIARQLISALNMNKSFYLPPRFCMLETANEKGSLVRLPGIAERGAAFGRRMAAER